MVHDTGPGPVLPYFKWMRLKDSNESPEKEGNQPTRNSIGFFAFFGAYRAPLTHLYPSLKFSHQVTAPQKLIQHVKPPVGDIGGIGRNGSCPVAFCRHLAHDPEPPG